MNIPLRENIFTILNPYYAMKISASENKGTYERKLQPPSISHIQLSFLESISYDISFLVDRQFDPHNINVTLLSGSIEITF